MVANTRFTRRQMLQLAAAAQVPVTKPTLFQIACMTLPYSPHPFERALKGIAAAGYRFVGWGHTHERKPILAPEAPSDHAKGLARLTRDIGLEPVMLFANVYVEAPESLAVHTRRIEQAEAAGIPFIITFGRTSPGAYAAWIRNLKELGPRARAAGVTLLIKQHGGETSTGRQCARMIADVADEGVKICYDAGNVLDYENVDPISDIQTCWRDIRAFAIKDHRNTPKDEDCGPGFGEIDHYKLLLPVARTGLTMPLACENIFEPLVPRPAAAEGVDALARRAREFLETVTRGLPLAR